MFGSGGKTKVRSHKRYHSSAVPKAKRRKHAITEKKGEQSRGATGKRGKASATTPPGGTRGKEPRKLVPFSRKFVRKKRKQTSKQFKNRTAM